MTEPTAAQLMDDLRAVVENAEALLKATSGQAGDRIDEARLRAEGAIKDARARLDDLGDDVTARARHAARQADRYVHDNPWPSIAVAAGVGFVLGLLATRR